MTQKKNQPSGNPATSPQILNPSTLLSATSDPFACRFHGIFLRLVETRHKRMCENVHAVIGLTEIDYVERISDIFYYIYIYIYMLELRWGLTSRFHYGQTLDKLLILMTNTKDFKAILFEYINKKKIKMWADIKRVRNFYATLKFWKFVWKKFTRKWSD